MSNGSDSEQQVEDSSPLLGTVVAVQANYYQVTLDTQESEGTSQEPEERIFSSSSPPASSAPSAPRQFAQVGKPAHATGSCHMPQRS